MESNTPDKQLKGFLLVPLTSHPDNFSISITDRISLHRTSVLSHCEKEYDYVSEVVGLEVRL